MIRILRNKEFQNMLLIMCVIALAAAAATIFFPIDPVAIVLITSFLLIACCVLFTRWRYRELEKLSRYLRTIASGNYTLDVRDNAEGELSILKNEIYKVTHLLSEQSSLLNRDKLHLTDAISDISHQLKTPLTSLLIMIDLLSQPDLPNAKRSEFTHNIRIQLERMEWLITSLLKLSKIDAGTIHFRKDQVQVEHLLQKAIQPLLIPIDIKELSIEVQGEDEAAFTGDLNWTAEAFINLLKNAVEHTSEGGCITIQYAENPLFTEIEIADTGKGIAKEDLPYIFKRFYKGKNAGDSSVGIGLAMAHSIVTSQNGTIDVNSRPGNGTKFRIKFYKSII